MKVLDLRAHQIVQWDRRRSLFPCPDVPDTLLLPVVDAIMNQLRFFPWDIVVRGPQKRTFGISYPFLRKQCDRISLCDFRRCLRLFARHRTI